MRWKTSRTCVRICEAKFGTLFRYDGKLIETRLRRSSPSGLSSWREPANTIPTFCVSGYCSNSLSQRLKPAKYHLIDLATGLSHGGFRSLAAARQYAREEAVPAWQIFRGVVRIEQHDPR
jgi:hypothetical protein